MEEGNLSGAEEYVAAEIEVAQPIGPLEEKAIRDSVAKAEGVRGDSLAIDECKVSVYYDPTKIAKEEVVKLISQTGVKANGVHTERSPPL